MAFFRIKKGLKANLPRVKEDGQILFTTDEGKLLIDTDNNTRIEVNASGANKLIKWVSDPNDATSFSNINQTVGGPVISETTQTIDGYNAVYFNDGIPVVIDSNKTLSNNVVSANKLNTNAGSINQPVYFSEGVPHKVNKGIIFYASNTTSGIEGGRTSENKTIFTKWNVRLIDSSIGLESTDYDEDGLVIAFKVPCKGAATGCAIKLNDDDSYHPVVYNLQTNEKALITTHFNPGTLLLAIYDKNSKVKIFGTAIGNATNSVMEEITGCWRVLNLYTNENTIPSAYCDTDSSAAKKVAKCTNYKFLDKSYLPIIFTEDNTATLANLTLSVNGYEGQLWINGEYSNANSTNLIAGSYIMYCEQDIETETIRYHIRTDGKLPGRSGDVDGYMPLTGGTFTGPVTFDSDIILGENNYGDILPNINNSNIGQLFFQTVDNNNLMYELPSQGRQGQILTKTSNIARLYEWRYPFKIEMVDFTLNNNTSSGYRYSPLTYGSQVNMDLNNGDIIIGTFSVNSTMSPTTQIFIRYKSNDYKNCYTNTKQKLTWEVLDATLAHTGGRKQIMLIYYADAWTVVGECASALNEEYIQDNAQYELLFTKHRVNESKAAITSIQKNSRIYVNPNSGILTAVKVENAVWNDYAEYRTADILEAGRCVKENGDDTLSITTERLSPCAGIISDTFGYSEGKTETAKTPIAVAGRVLAYPYQDRNNYQPGDAVCAAPGGTVDIMTREEIINYPDRIIGIVSCVPSYLVWGSGNTVVNNRIWIKVK